MSFKGAPRFCGDHADLLLNDKVILSLPMIGLDRGSPDEDLENSLEVTCVCGSQHNHDGFLLSCDSRGQLLEERSMR